MDASTDLTEILRESIVNCVDSVECQQEVDAILRHNERSSVSTMNLKLLHKYNSIIQAKFSSLSAVEHNVIEAHSPLVKETVVRVLIVILTMVCFIMMNGLLVTKHLSYEPQTQYHYGCSATNGFNGQFSPKPYKAVLGVAAGVFGINILQLFFNYCKGVGYCSSFIEGQLSESPSNEPLVALSPRLKAFLSSISVFMLDGLLCLICAATSLIATIALQSSTRYEINEYTNVVVYCNNYNYISRFATVYYYYYFTIASFFATYEHKNCMNKADNPVALIHWSLAMLYIVVVLLAYITMVNFRLFYKHEKRAKLIQSSNAAILVKNNTSSVKAEEGVLTESENPLSGDTVISSVVESTTAAANSEAALRTLLLESLTTVGGSGEVHIELSSLMATNQQSPHTFESALNVQLFRKYQKLVDAKLYELSERALHQTDHDITPVESTVLLPSMLYNVLYLRCGVLCLALIGVIVMATASVTQRAEYRPQQGYNFNSNQCLSCGMSGYFNARPYQRLMTAGIVLCVVNVLHIARYFIPVNEQGEKYIPGCKALYDIIMEQLQLPTEPIVQITVSPRLKSFCAFVLDSVLCMCTLLLCISASIILEKPEKFLVSSRVSVYGICGNDSTAKQYDDKFYFTINTFFATFGDNDHDNCMKRENPVPKIRGSLAMMYLAVLLLALITVANYRLFRQSRLDAAAATSAMNDVGDENRSNEDKQVQMSLLKSDNNNNNNNSNDDSEHGGQSV